MRRHFCPAVIGAALAIACGDGIGPDPQFSQQITIEDLEATLGAGPGRLEIEAASGTAPLTAEEVEVAGADELGEEEKIEAAIAGLDRAASGCGGTLTLTLGGLSVAFDADTEFEGEDEDEQSCDEFMARVEEALAQGQQPQVEAERAAPSTPQAPDDATFLAAEIELGDEPEDDGEGGELEVDVSAANLEACGTLSSPPSGCLGVIRVFNVPFVVVDGVTELKAEREDAADEVEFEGVVASAEPGASCDIGTVVLEDGTVVQVVSGTDNDHESGDDDDLGDLCEVKTALDAGQTVEAEGEGILMMASPRTITAVEIEFEQEDGGEGEG